MALKTRTELLHGYFFLSYLTVLTLCLGYLDTAPPADPWTVTFCLFTLTSYSMVYLLPAFAITMGANRLFGCWKGKDNLSSLNTFTVSVMAISTTSATLIALYADRQIYHLFGFHFNSFVMNLITTPGGIASMVLITGDHGEEFLENGHWGHNSEFTDQQTRVPLVLYIPGTGQSTVSRMTSHLDIAPTLLPLLGLKNRAENFSQGYDLFAGDKRTFTVISDWNRIGFVDENFKATFPLKRTALLHNRFTTGDDKPLGDPAVFWENKRDVVVSMMRDLSRFRQSK